MNCVLDGGAYAMTSNYALDRFVKGLSESGPLNADVRRPRCEPLPRRS